MTKNELLSEVNRKLRNLKRAGYMTPARENLEKHFGRGYIKSIDSAEDRYEANKFVRAQTSTAAGYKSVRKAQAANFKNYLMRMVPGLRRYSPEEQAKIKAVIESWTPLQAEKVAAVYKPLIQSIKDSDQEAVAINTLLMDKIARYNKASIAKITEAILSPREIKATERQIMTAQITAGDYMTWEGSKIADAIRKGGK